MNEIWKDVVGYEGLYQVSNLGRVKSVERYRKGKRGSMTYCKERILSSRISNAGYYQTCVCKENMKKLLLTHRMIAKAFIPNEKELKCVDHINGIRTDNRVLNLRWCSHKDNLNFDLARENISKSAKASEKHRKHITSIAKGCCKEVVVVFQNGIIKEYESAAATENDGFHHSNVAACCKGKQKTTHKCRCYYKTDFYGNKAGVDN